MLRPQTLDEVQGQVKVKKQLRISINASKIKGTVYPHCCFSGNKGIGKTTIAECMANELNVPIEVCNGANLRNVRSLLPYLARIQHSSILFCDELHKCSPLVQTYLLTVIEQFRYTVGSQQDSVTLELPEFTFIGATTSTGLILDPLLNRFIYKYALENYSIEDLTQIILVNSKKLDLDIGEDCAKIIAGTCRGTGRTSVNRLQWISDYITSNSIGRLTPEETLKALAICGVSADGMEPDDRKYLMKLNELKSASLNTLASATGIDVDTIQNNIEPFLIEKGLIKKTTKGRQLI
jgi:Holliday junction DNA helicase RuvB